jgi:transposase-like protein
MINICYGKDEIYQRRNMSTSGLMGIYLQARMDSEKNCILVIIGVDEYGKKELVAIDDGFRESKESWQGLLLDIKSRGLIHSPALAVGDGALGFWGSLTEEYPNK